jgi:CRISPR type I-E-associated protein CasB/Cse2
MTDTHAREENLHPFDPRNAAGMARGLTQRGITPGDIAKLKRMNAEHPTEKVFWEQCVNLGIDQAPEGLISTWAGISIMIAKGTKVTEQGATGPHEGNTPLGRALANSGYKEERFKTLLNADNSSIARMLDRAVTYLYSKGQNFNWNDAARLALSGHRSQREKDRDRMRIARDYYRETQVERTGQKE